VDAPSGVVTFLFTDIEGSTRRWESDADGMRAALLAHDDVLRTAIEDHGRREAKHDMTDIIDTTKTFRLLEERIAQTTNPRHLLMLKRVLDHARGETNLDLDLVMSTLCANPRYVAWGAPADLSPVGRQAVRTFYEETIVKGGQWFLEMDMDRIVVDDDTIVTEGFLRSIYYGADAAARGFPVDDQDGFYLLTLRMLVVWPFDAEGFIEGEETYTAVTTPDFFKKIDTSEVPQKFRDFISAR
jgi:hypothetical protein